MSSFPDHVECLCDNCKRDKLEKSERNGPERRSLDEQKRARQAYFSLEPAERKEVVDAWPSRGFSNTKSAMNQLRDPAGCTKSLADVTVELAKATRGKRLLDVVRNEAKTNNGGSTGPFK